MNSNIAAHLKCLPALARSLGGALLLLLPFTSIAGTVHLVRNINTTLIPQSSNPAPLGGLAAEEPVFQRSCHPCSRERDPWRRWHRIASSRSVVFRSPSSPGVAVEPPARVMTRLVPPAVPSVIQTLDGPEASAETTYSREPWTRKSFHGVLGRMPRPVSR
jgi:hypothetical protein